MLEKFSIKTLENVCGKAHDVYIGEWARWWLKEKNRVVISPGLRVKRRGRCSDIMFCEGSGDSYKVLGVAEIETSHNTLEDKIETLSRYVNDKEKFPNIKFVILCTRACPTDDHQNYWCGQDKNEERFPPVIKKIKQSSDCQRDVSWVFFILRQDRERDSSTTIDNKSIKEFSPVYYQCKFTSIDFMIVQEGKVIATSKKSILKSINKA